MSEGAPRRRRLLVAPDSFKGTFTAPEVAAAIGAGVAAAGSEADLCPLADGGEGTAAYPHVANLPPAAPAVPHGIIPRLTSLVARIKAAKNYSDDIGRELNIIGAAQIVDTDSAKPILDISKKAGQPSIQWPKGDADAIEIWVDRSDEKGFGFLTIANSTRVPDNAPLPATPVTWQYKAIYRVKDNRVGEWSDVVSITAGG